MANEWRMHNFQDKLADQMPEAKHWRSNGIQDYLKLPRPVSPVSRLMARDDYPKEHVFPTAIERAFWDNQLEEICRRSRTPISCWRDRCCSIIEWGIQRMYKEEQSTWDHKKYFEVFGLITDTNRSLNWLSILIVWSSKNCSHSFRWVSWSASELFRQTDHWWGLSI